MRKIYFLIKSLFRIPVDFIKKNTIHKSVRISNNVLLSRTSIGMETYIGCNAVINNTEIGNYSSIAPGVQIGGMEHSYWWLSTSTSLSKKCISSNRTYIGNDVWIAAGTIIKQGVKIGDGAVIGAMSFVNKDVEENSIYFGQPAKFYKKRLEDEVFSQLKLSNYWNYKPIIAREILKDISI